MIRSQVAYTVYPVGFLLQRLAGDTITAKSVQSDEIVQRAQLREDYEEILSDSQVFMHIGHLEPYLTVYSSEINQLANEQLDLSTLNAVYDFQRYTQVIADGEITYVESPYYRGEEFQMIDTDIQDLYLWTDPIAMLSMAKDIRDWLIATYPDEKSIYEVNFTRLETDLINLDAQYQALATANEKNDKVIRFVSMTASFGNWQKTYGFQVYPVVLSKYGVLPNARQLELIEERIRTDGVKYIVYEPNMTDDMVSLFNRIEDDLGLRRVELSNLSSLTGSESGKDYLSIMYENLNALETMTEDRTASEETTAVEADAAEALTTEESS
ncbi:MAG: zinc ABC transporter substrate-binding protein, partial [Erysipelotrichaceae bacterium]|nr:zinc ABC transporter substrate-binding protein [Erysipelotrichaceae bacterium]